MRALALAPLFGRFAVGRARQTAASATRKVAARVVKSLVIMWSLTKEGDPDGGGAIAATSSKSESLGSKAPSQSSPVCRAEGHCIDGASACSDFFALLVYQMRRRQIETVAGFASLFYLLLLLPFIVLFALEAWGILNPCSSAKRSFATRTQLSSFPIIFNEYFKRSIVAVSLEREEGDSTRSLTNH